MIMKSQFQSFRAEVIKVWRWVVFVWGLLGQMGGLGGILQAVGKAVTIPLKRL